jgi:hypothetical protein
MVALAPITNETPAWDVLDTFPKLHSRAREAKTTHCTEARYSNSLSGIEIWLLIYESCDGLESFTRDPIGYKDGRSDDFLPQFLLSQDRYLAEDALRRNLGQSFSRRGRPQTPTVSVSIGLYDFLGGSALGYSDPFGYDRYWIGGTHPLAHSTICVDTYDATGIKSGVYCCTIGAEGGSCGRKASGILDLCHGICATFGFAVYEMKITCGSFPSVEAWNVDGFPVRTYPASKTEDAELLDRMMKENGTSWNWNGPFNNCHDHVGPRCRTGKPEKPRDINIH